MGRARTAQPVKLFCAMLSADPDLRRRARHLLARTYGPIDLECHGLPFDETDYYAEEMGANLVRSFVAFERLIRGDDLATIKRETNQLEDDLASACAALDTRRPVNLDPGYVDLSRTVLATTKDRAHRIYLGAGIYAEVTLQFANGAWQPQPWTYASYRNPAYHAFLEQVRARLADQRRAADAALNSPS